MFQTDACVNIYNGDTHGVVINMHVILHIIYFISTPIKNGVVDDGVPAILHYRPSDLYLADSKETMMVEVGNNHDCRFVIEIEKQIQIQFELQR